VVGLSGQSCAQTSKGRKSAGKGQTALVGGPDRIQAGRGGDPRCTSQTSRVQPTTRPQSLNGVGRPDRSGPSSKALAGVAEEARLRGATLKVVHAWNLPMVTSGAYLPIGGMEGVPTEAAAQIAALARQVDRHTVTGPLHPAVRQYAARCPAPSAPPL
jgi:hypothetical protein